MENVLSTDDLMTCNCKKFCSLTYAKITKIMNGGYMGSEIILISGKVG